MSVAVELLERYLAKAREGHFTSVAISATGHGGYQHHYTGGDEDRQLKSILELGDRIQATIDNWQPYATDWSLDESYACYHMYYGPRGFDFLTWLLANEMLRVAAKATGPLKVAFWQGHVPKPDPWLDPVYRPMLKLVGAVEDNRALQRMGKEIYLTKALVDMQRLGMPLPKLKAASEWNLPRNVVTITLREADHWPHRNSNAAAWHEFALLLESQGERVVFVRDTVKADDGIPGQEICPIASKDIDARMWLYQNAKLNCFVSNGPMMLATLTDNVPYLCFVPPEKDTTYIQNLPLFWKIKMGVEMGTQFPWAAKNQRIVWDKDSFENIKKGYEEWRDN